MKSTKSFIFALKTMGLTALYFLIATNVKAQTPAATDPVYIQREYMKIMPSDLGFSPRLKLRVFDGAVWQNCW